MAATLVEEPELRAAEGQAHAQAAATETARDAWERFLTARAREAASRPLARWRDEEGL